MKRQILVLSATMILAACGTESTPSPVNNGNNGTVGSNNGTGSSNNGTGGSNNGTATNSSNNSTITADTFFFEDVKPIMDAKCVGCHTAGQIGPFELKTFEQVSAVKDLVKLSVERKTMPPQLEDSACNELAFDPSLSDEQIATIGRWVDQGAEMGDPMSEGPALVVELPEAPVFDTIAEMPEAYTPQASPDDYRCFIIDWPHADEKFITGFGVEPGEPKVVHHVIAFKLPPELQDEAAAKDAAEPGPGYTCFGDTGVGNQLETQWLGSWAPGSAPSRFAEGTGIKMEQGSKLIVQLHYNTLTTAPAPDLTKVMFETSDTVDQEGQWILWANPSWLRGGMNIPAGNADQMHKFAFDPTQAYGGNKMTFYNGGLHMHLLGKSASTYVKRAGGGEECLINIPRWDFNWQGGAQFKEPMVLNRGDELQLECHWDNSLENQPMVDGTPITPADRNWGDGSTDEMCLGVYYVTID